MVVSVGSNISALRAQRQVERSSAELSRAYERLSSGMRINRASDDAAGLAIVSKLAADTRVYTQAIRNANDGLSALSIAQGTLQQATNVIVRLQELATSAANGPFARTQRVTTNKEAQQLVNELNRMFSTSDFNGLKLLDGTLSNLSIQVGYGTNGQIGFTIGSQLRRYVNSGQFDNETLGFNSNLNGNGELSYSNRAADFNNDGYEDLALGGGSDIMIVFGGANGITDSSPAINLSNTSGSLLVADIQLSDINNDGKVDVVATDFYSGSVYTVINNGNGTFQTATQILNPDANNFASSLQIADINSDGNQDLVYIGRNTGGTFGVSIYAQYGTGNGTFSAASRFDPGVGDLTTIRIGDLDGDGGKDLIVQGENGLYTGSFSSTGRLGGLSFKGAYIGTSFQYAELETGDFNNDGLLDLVVSNNGTSSQLLLGQANGSFLNAFQLNSSYSTYSIGIRDINGDGNLDILAQTDSVQILLGNGDGTFQSDLFSPVGTIYAYGDFNGDGTVDLWGCSYGSTISLNGVGRQTNTIQSFNLSTAQAARNALSPLSNLLSKMSRELGSIGATQSRLTSSLNTLSAARENFTGAAGRIRDADMAAESAQLARLQILRETGASVLAQASQEPALAISLLRG